MIFPLRIYWLKRKKYIFLCILLVLLYFYAVFTKSSLSNLTVNRNLLNNFTYFYNSNETEKIPSKSELQVIWMKQKIQRLSRSSTQYDKFRLLSNGTMKPNRNVHVFYYASFRNKKTDGEWRNWNSNFMFDSNIDFLAQEYYPPTDIASAFYPALGCYSSKNLSVITEHMKLIRDAGIGVVVISWCPLNEKDFPKDLFQLLLDSAFSNDLRVAIHFQECTKTNNLLLFVLQLQHIIKNFGSHAALYKIQRHGKYLPVYYVYNVEKNFANQFGPILSQSGNLSIRGTKYDGFFIGLLSTFEQLRSLKRNLFDGFYTYFGSNGLSYGSSWKNWQSLSKFARNNKLLFSPSVAPGFSDVNVKFWNSNLEKHRLNGRYYEVAWRAAITSNPNIISVTSFNDWHGGTQIEPAVPKKFKDVSYKDYSPYNLYYYANLTRYWITIYTNKLIKT